MESNILNLLEGLKLPESLLRVELGLQHLLVMLLGLVELLQRRGLELLVKGG